MRRLSATERDLLAVLRKAESSLADASRMAGWSEPKLLAEIRAAIATAEQGAAQTDPRPEEACALCRHVHLGSGGCGQMIGNKGSMCICVGARPTPSKSEASDG